MLDRIKDRPLELVARIVSSAALAGVLSLAFTFIHRSVLGWGGHPRNQQEMSDWIQHEDVYGPILFSLLFIGLVTRGRQGLGLIVSRSVCLATSVVVAFAVLALGANDDHLHLDHFLIAIGTCAFAAILLAQRSHRAESQPRA